MQLNQLIVLHEQYDQLQLKYGAPELNSVYGAGKIYNPELVLVFMNPTGRNVSANPDWKGLRAPWLGTKQVWDMLSKLNLFSHELNVFIQRIKTDDWTVSLAEDVYNDIFERNMYLTNLAKCTQVDARPLQNVVFKQYRELMLRELDLLKPKYVISFGNQVSSILLGKNVSVRAYRHGQVEVLGTKDGTYNVAPTYYPVGQGRRNMPHAIQRIVDLTTA